MPTHPSFQYPETTDELINRYNACQNKKEKKVLGHIASTAVDAFVKAVDVYDITKEKIGELVVLTRIKDSALQFRIIEVILRAVDKKGASYPALWTGLNEIIKQCQGDTNFSSRLAYCTLPILDNLIKDVSGLNESNTTLVNLKRCNFLVNLLEKGSASINLQAEIPHYDSLLTLTKNWDPSIRHEAMILLQGLHNMLYMDSCAKEVTRSAHVMATLSFKPGKPPIKQEGHIVCSLSTENKKAMLRKVATGNISSDTVSTIIPGLLTADYKRAQIDFKRKNNFELHYKTSQLLDRLLPDLLPLMTEDILLLESELADACSLSEQLYLINAVERYIPSTASNGYFILLASLVQTETVIPYVRFYAMSLLLDPVYQLRTAACIEHLQKRFAQQLTSKNIVENYAANVFFALQDNAMSIDFINQLKEWKKHWLVHDKSMVTAIITDMAVFFAKHPAGALNQLAVQLENEILSTKKTSSLHLKNMAKNADDVALPCGKELLHHAQFQATVKAVIERYNKIVLKETETQTDSAYKSSLVMFGIQPADEESYAIVAPNTPGGR